MIEPVNAGDTLTIGSGQAIATTGANRLGLISADLVSNGLVDADGGQIRLNNTVTTNNNLIRARNGGTLRLEANSTIENAAGTITIEAGSTLAPRGGSVIRGGVIDGGGDITINGGSVGLDGIGMTLDDLRIRIGLGNSAILLLSGQITNNSSIQLTDTNTNSLAKARIRLDGPVNIDGVGDILFTTRLSNFIEGLSGTNATLTLGPGQTVRGSAGTNGSISVETLNHGTLQSDGRINFSGSAFTNASDGTVAGSGEFNFSNRDFTNHGLFSPGGSPGRLTLTGNTIDHTPTARFLIEIAGETIESEYDTITANGTMNLDGDLTVALLGGFVPDRADAFTILTASTINGFFANAPPDAGGVGALNMIDARFDVIYSAGSVVLANYVPEPDFGCLLAATLLWFVWRRPR